MTNSNNGKTIALVVIVVVLALFAFRSVFFLLPFGVLPGIARSAGEAGPSISGFLHGFGPIGRLALLLLPAAFIVLWGAVLIWVYRDAEKRGMSGILWLLLVLIGNVIGLLIFAIVRSETPTRRRDRGEPATPAPVSPLEKCGGCGKPLGPGFEFCPYCGKALKKTCPACGKPVQDDWKVCPACGAGIDPGGIRQA
ncbi:MAG: zinc ribbon domain-containing protein [Candidatus Aminicenantes bacterium]|nr:zinc ribbon domain-containing protein [Candidatus Aminicenantes bacterium]